MAIFLHKTFRKLKDIFWPIERSELSFFIPMALLMMCALYNFAALRAVKDSLIVSNIGAESISFLKLWLVLPVAVIFTIIYLKLSNIFSVSKVFYIVTGCFLLFFWLFAFWIYPNKDLLHPDKDLITTYTLLYPNFKWFIYIAGSWSYALMYIFSELWSVVVINLMFWQFANSIIDTNHARRFYPLFGMIGNFGLIIAGNALVYFSDLSGVPATIVNFASYNCKGAAEISLKLSIMSIVFVGVILLAIMFYINNFVLKNSSHLHPDNESSANPNEEVTSLSLKDSIKLILKSPYIGYITIVIICYGLAINILEGPWKAKIKELHPTQDQYLAFMGHFNIWMGISCVTFMVIGSNVLRLLGWLAAALFTPVTMGITGLAFFTFVVYADFFNEFIDYSRFNPLYAAVIAGALQNILSKSSKYSMFDATKEMAYIPLSLELKTKGKAAAEVLGAKIGKSLGAIIQSTMFTLMPHAGFEEISPVLMVIFIFIIGIWLFDVLKLSKAYENILKSKNT